MNTSNINFARTLRLFITVLVFNPLLSLMAESGSQTAFSGSYNVGSGGDFTTITEAINHLTSGGVTGPVTLFLIDATYLSETVPLTIGAIPGASAVNTITLKPAPGVVPVIAKSSNSALIKFDGASHFIIDGSNTAGGTTRDLTIRNTSTYSWATVVWIASKGAGEPSSFITITNCYMEGGVVSTNSMGVAITGTSSTFSAGESNNHISISNNQVSKCLYAITVYGGNTNRASELSITGNLVGNAASSLYVGKFGIYLLNTTGSEITGNTIFNIVSSGSGPVGIYLADKCSEIGVSRNSINNIRYTATGSGQGRGIVISTFENPSNITLVNNIIYNVGGAGYYTITSIGAGIYIYAANGIELYYNTVNFYGKRSRSGATSDFTAALFVGLDVTNVAAKNNIFINSYENPDGVATGYAVYVRNSSSPFTAGGVNNNCYFVSGPEGVLFYANGGEVTTLSGWRSFTGQDAYSISADPYIESNTSLKVSVHSPCIGAATPLTGVTTDYLQASRNPATPAIGAYEAGYLPQPIVFCNLNSPGAETKAAGTDPVTVAGRVRIDGVTSLAGAAMGLEVSFGYAVSNSDPSGWTNWTAAQYSAEGADYEEYITSFGSNFPAGSYYFTFRFRYKGGGYSYGGYSLTGGGFWDGSLNTSGVLNVTTTSVASCNIRDPLSVSIQEGDNLAVKNLVRVAGVTDRVAAQPGITAWIGWSLTNSDPAGWTSWTPATFTGYTGTEHEYTGVVEAEALQSGAVLYYACRFKFMDDTYRYGGVNGFWATGESGVLTVGEKTVTSFPYFQGFEGASVTPPGWRNPSDLWKLTYLSGAYSGGAAAGVEYNHDPLVQASLITCKFVLPAAMRVRFYWSDDDVITPFASLRARSGASINQPAITGHDVTYFEISSDNGATWTTLATLSEDEPGGYFEELVDLTAWGGQTVIFRFRDVTDASEEAYGTGVDDFTIEKKASATSTAILPANQLVTQSFGLTGVSLLVYYNDDQLDLTVDRVESNPGGTLPAGIMSLSATHWRINRNSGYLTVTYDLILDISGIDGVIEPTSLHLLKRGNASEEWEDLGEPGDVSGDLLTWYDLDSFSEIVLGGDGENPLPVELASFTARVKGREITLNWETKSEVNTNSFILEEMSEGAGGWRHTAVIDAAGMSNSPKYYSWKGRISEGNGLNFRLKMVDNDGSFEYSPVVKVTVGLPAAFSVSQNYPNPFNPATTIEYELQESSEVTLEIYSVSGELVRLINPGIMESGYHSLDVTAGEGMTASGVYFYRLKAMGISGAVGSAIRKMILMK